jgi:hypothetical protein
MGILPHSPVQQLRNARAPDRLSTDDGTTGRGGDRLNESAIQAALAAVDYVRDELAAGLSQLPDSTQLQWRSAAQRTFQSRVDDLECDVHDAMAVLAAVRDELGAQSAALAAASTGR